MASSTCVSGLVEYLRKKCSVLDVGIYTYVDSLAFILSEGKPEVRDVEMRPGRPASAAEISSWEKVYIYTFNTLTQPVYSLPLSHTHTHALFLSRELDVSCQMM